jgi:hypothetical protein
MGCLFAVMAGAFPRFMFLVYWIVRPEKVDAAFSSFIWPVLGIVFLPFATLMYVLLYLPGRGVTSWDWWWVGLAALFDLAHLAGGAGQRRQEA